MNEKTYQGHIRTDVAVFDEPVNLPDGLKVCIVPVVEQARKAGERTTLAERFENVIGAVDDLPEGIEKNHDHYLHGEQ